jgi:octaprenyl-diphosphate synthase
MIEAFQGLKDHFAAVERLMAESLSSPEARVDGLINELGPFHGKMLRPALVLLVAETLGEVTERHQRLGAALEMIHTATLIHDDLIDDSDTRRGKSTAHVRFGNTTAVLLGDYFYTHAFNLVAAMGDAPVMSRLTETTNIVCRGELHQQCAARDVSLSEEEYGRIIYAKTAALTELAGELGAVAGEPSQRRAAAGYGLACGIAFQIVDDCLDFSGDPLKVGKTLSTDIERGRLTLPIIRLLKRTDPAKRPQLEQQLVSAFTPQDVDAVRTLVSSSGAIEDALGTARDHVKIAQRHLEQFPPGQHRDRLWMLAEFIVQRDF